MTPIGLILWLLTEVPVATARDVALFLLGLPLLILAVLRYIVVDIPNAQPGSELYLRDRRNVQSCIKQVLLLLASISPFFLLFWVYRVVMVALQNLLRVLPFSWRGWPEQEEVAYKGDKKESHDNLNFFVNGICTDENWLQLNCKTLEHHLGEQVVGIHNQSFGLLIDLVECLLQRDWRFYTESVTQAAHIVENALKEVDGTDRKVRLMGHSQGGIIVSLVVDYLINYVFIPGKYPHLTKNLEVYTFASAADKFRQVHPPLHPILIKHYGNQFDLVAILGVLGVRWFYINVIYRLKKLYHGRPNPDEDDRYAGSIFVHKGAFGHLLSANYVFSKSTPYVSLTNGDPAPF